MATTSQPHLPTYLEAVRDYKDDLVLQRQKAGLPAPTTATGSDWDMKAVSTVNRFATVVDALKTYDDDSNPLVANGDPLDELIKAEGLPEVLPAPGRGKILSVIDGVATIPSGLKFQASGMKGHSTRTILESTGEVQVDVVMESTGPLSNLAPGTVVRWMNQPANVRTEAMVIERFVGGVDVESTERKRQRLLLSKQNPPGGGNWSQFVLEALNASGSISGAFAYPTLGGPASKKVVLCSNTTAGDRTVPDEVQEAVRARFREKFPTDQALVVVQSTLNQMVDVMLGLRLPKSGSGTWLAHGPTSPLVIVSRTSATEFVAQANTGTGEGIRENDIIACWNKDELAFATATVSFVEVSGSYANAFHIKTGLWSGPDPVWGSWLCPACEGLDVIASEWLKQMLSLGPGENVAESDPRYVFAYRHPDPTEGAPIELSSRQIGALQEAITDIIRAEYLPGYTPIAPVVPATVQNAPFTLCLNQFGVFPI